MTSEASTHSLPVSSVLNSFILALAALNFAPGHLGAQTITFETLPDGSPLAGGTVISNQFAATPYGVSFRFEDGSYPVIRRVGGNINGKPTAFKGYPNDTGYNTPAPGQNVGTNFISDDAQVDAPPAPFVITYTTPVASASGFILDVDHSEAWDVYARNSQTQVVASVHLEHDTPGTGDGVATPFSFNRPTADIKSIRIVFTGNTNEQPNVGLAFDSFSPASPLVTPTPARLELRLQSTNVSMVLSGTPQAVYAIESLGRLDRTSTNWQPVTSVVLPFSSFALTNLDVLTTTQRLYRAVGLIYND
jgi:hypothetical protein